MRKDMGKIITERPRHGSGNRSAKTGMSIPWKGHDAEYDIERKASSARFRQYGYEARSFTDVLGPLYGFLDKQVGRPWNKVYSELCAFLDKRKVTHAHVFTHIDFYVEKDVYKGVDGRWHSRPYGGEVRGLYVNPKTGLICRQKPPKEPPRDKDFDLVRVTKELEYRRYDGIWYRCDIAQIPRIEMVFDRVTKEYKHVQRGWREEITKKQIGSRELKKLGLENIRDKNYNPKDGPNKKEYTGTTQR